MRKSKYSIFLFLSLIIFPVGFVTAITSEGLFWGFNVGDEFYFTYTEEVHTPNYSTFESEEVILRINRLHEIDDPLLYGGATLHVAYTVEYANGTPVDIYLRPYLIAFPIGNWTLFTAYFLDYFERVQEWDWDEGWRGVVIDQVSIWGLDFYTSLEDTLWGTNSTSYHTYHFSKSDGFINYARRHSPIAVFRDGAFESGDEYYAIDTLTRNGYIGGILGFDPVFVLIGAIGLVSIVMIIMVTNKRKEKL